MPFTSRGQIDNSHNSQRAAGTVLRNFPSVSCKPHTVLAGPQEHQVPSGLRASALLAPFTFPLDNSISHISLTTIQMSPPQKRFFFPKRYLNILSKIAPQHITLYPLPSFIFFAELSTVCHCMVHCLFVSLRKKVILSLTPSSVGPTPTECLPGGTCEPSQSSKRQTVVPWLR